MLSQIIRRPVKGVLLGPVLILLVGCLGTHKHIEMESKPTRWYQKPVYQTKVAPKVAPWDDPWKYFKEPRLFPRIWHRDPKFVIRFIREVEIRRTRDL